MWVPRALGTSAKIYLLLLHLFPASCRNTSLLVQLAPDTPVGDPSLEALDIKSEGQLFPELTHLAISDNEKILYILPGAPIELFGPADTLFASVTFLKESYNLDAGQGKEKRLLLEGKLSSLANQNVILYTGNQDNSWRLRADIIYSSAQQIDNLIDQLKQTVTYLRRYFPSRMSEISKPSCNLQISSPDVHKVLENMIRLLDTHSAVNNSTNDKILDANNVISIKQSDGVDLLSEMDIDLALSHVEWTIFQCRLELNKLSSELVLWQEDMESLLNMRVSPNVLAGLGIRSTCVEPKYDDLILVTDCRRSHDSITCFLDIMRSGTGTMVNKLVAVPYRHGDGAVKIHFPANSAFRPGSGNLYSLEECVLIRDKARCSNIQVTANDCLEHVQTTFDLVPDGCVIDLVPSSRPLITHTLWGTLVAQRSDTALTMVSHGKAITVDPTVVSNRFAVTIMYGTETIRLAPLTAATGKIHPNAGNGTLLFETYLAQSWDRDWEDLIPVKERVLLLLFSLLFQLALFFPILLRILNAGLDYFGLGTNQDRQGSLAARYRRRGSLSDHSDISFDLHPLPRRRSSVGSSRPSLYSNDSRMRLQNQKALQKALSTV